MTDKRLYEWCGKIIEARVARDYKREKRLSDALDRIMARDAKKEEKVAWIIIAVVIIGIITLSIFFIEFIFMAIMAVPFIAQALKDGANMN